LNDDNSPWKRPSGVRAAATMTTGSGETDMAEAPGMAACVARPIE
jgi:hypothetical protein